MSSSRFSASPRFRSALPLAVALFLAACGASPEEQLQRAQSAFAENRFSAARVDLAALLQERPDDPQLLELLARTQLQLGDGEGAQATLARLGRTGAAPADLAAMQAEAALLQGDFDAALTLADGLADAEGARLSALAHLGLGDVEAAAAAFAQGQSREGEKGRLLADHALFRLQQGDAAMAQDLAAQALAEMPEGLDPLMASARVALARGDLAAALGHYEAASAAFPESRAALLGRIGILGDLGRLAEARPLIQDAVRQAPGDADFIYLSARLAAEDGQWREVRDLLQPLATDGAPALRQLYAQALIELELPEQALALLPALIRAAPEAAEPRRLLARAELASGDAAGAMETIRPLATQAAGSPQDLALFAAAARAAGREGEIATALAAAPPAERVARLLATGDAALAQQNWRGAIDAYRQLEGWTGDSNAMVLNNLAYALGRAGRYEEALPFAERAARLVPGNASILDTLGWLLVSSGTDRDRGLDLLRQAARIDPGNRVIAARLEQYQRQQ